jgi:hypothetical protein
VSFSSRFIPDSVKTFDASAVWPWALLGIFFCLHWVGVAHVEENANVWEMKLFFLMFPLPVIGCS